MIPSTSVKRSPLTFFVLVFALSLPFWLAAALTSFELLPALPVTSLVVVCPVTAAAILAIMAAVVVMVWGPHTLTRYGTHSGKRRAQSAGREEGSGHVSIPQ